MSWIEELPNSNLQIPFWSMPPSVRVIINDVVGGYYITVAGRSYEGQGGFQYLLLVSIPSLYAFSLFGRGWSTIWIQYNSPLDLAENSDKTFLRLAVFATLLIGQTSVYSMFQGTWRVIKILSFNITRQRHQSEISYIPLFLVSDYVKIRRKIKDICDG